MFAIDNSDYIVKVITGSANIAEAKEKLTLTLPLSQKQVSAILKMKLNEFVQMDSTDIKFEYLSLKEILL